MTISNQDYSLGVVSGQACLGGSEQQANGD